MMNAIDMRARGIMYGQAITGCCSADIEPTNWRDVDLDTLLSIETPSERGVIPKPAQPLSPIADHQIV